MVHDRWQKLSFCGNEKLASGLCRCPYHWELNSISIFSFGPTHTHTLLYPSSPELSLDSRAVWHLDKRKELSDAKMKGESRPTFPGDWHTHAGASFRQKAELCDSFKQSVSHSLEKQGRPRAQVNELQQMASLLRHLHNDIKHQAIRAAFVSESELGITSFFFWSSELQSPPGLSEVCNKLAS